MEYACADTGFRFAPYPGVKRREWRLPLLATVLTACGFTGVLGNLLRATTFFPFLLCIVATLLSFACAGNWRSCTLCHSSLAVLATTAVLLRPTIITIGFPMLVNQIFTVSAETQSYHYEMLQIVSPDTADMNGTLCLLALSIAVLCGIAARRQCIAIPCILLLLYTVMEIYFGIFPALFPQTILTAGMVLTLLTAGGNRNCGVILLCLAVIATTMAVTGIFYTAQNPALHAFSEAVRDAVALNILYQSPDTAAVQPEMIDQTEYLQTHGIDASLSAETDNDGWQPVDTPTFAGSEAGTTHPRFNWIPFFTVIIFVILLLPLLRYLKRGLDIVRARKLRAADTETAARALLAYLLEWLHAYGLPLENTVYSSYIEPLAALISNDYAREYATVIHKWQLLVYGTSQTPEADLNVLRAFVSKTKRTILEKSGLSMRVKYRLVYFL